MSNITLIAKPSNHISGDIDVPGDKSISHRAIILSMLSEGKTKIYNLLDAEDIRSTMRVSEALGLSIIKNNEYIEIDGLGMDGLLKPSSKLDFGNSGTSIRLFMGILSFQSFTTILTGDESLMTRPMERVALPLREMGASISTTNGNAPIEISPSKNTLHGIDYQLDIPSAQIKSAIILASLSCKSESRIKFNTITRDHTERMLSLFQYPIVCSKNSITVKPGRLVTPKEIYIPGDFSSASFFIIAALLSKESRITISNIGLNNTRIGLIKILQLMGANIDIDITSSSQFEIMGDITINSSNLIGIHVPNELISLSIDELPLVFLAAAVAKGETIIRNAGELRLKESDRIKSMVSLLKNLNIEAIEYPDGANIIGGVITGGQINSYGDHRIAMSALVASCASRQEIEVSNCENINTSFPTFITLMNSIGMDISSKEI